MDWWTHPDWLALRRRVIDDPADDTVRLVAADWLADHFGNVPSAQAREALIREQVSGRWSPGFGVNVADCKPLDALGFPEPCLLKTKHFRPVRGFVEEVTFNPHRFNVDNVAPVFQSCPIKTCSLDRVAPARSYDRDSENKTRWYWYFHGGPEDGMGRIDNFRQVGIEGDMAAEWRHLARDGVNPHEIIYNQSGVIPYPVFNAMGKSRMRGLRAISSVALKACWRVGRVWANLPAESCPRPSDSVVGFWVTQAETYLTRGYNVDNEPAPNSGEVRTISGDTLPTG